MKPSTNYYDPETFPVLQREGIIRRNENVSTGKDLCEACDGTGNTSIHRVVECAECKGTGVKKV